MSSHKLSQYLYVRTTAALLLIASAAAGPRDRITSPVDSGRTRAISGNVHRLAQPQFDRGDADAGMQMNDVVVLFTPSAAQQAGLDQLLADQQNPSSARFRKWLSPDEFGSRFGLSSADHSKVTAWLQSQGFTIHQASRGKNWIAFNGTAGQISKALHTPIHRFEINGEMRFANTGDPAVPEALAGVIGGFLGLNDFRLHSNARIVTPDSNSGTNHLLAPEDYGTIYDIAPLTQAGFDGTGQTIAIVGESDVLLTDLRAFKTRYNLPANDPKMVLYSTTDPGFTGAQLEGNLDLEWAGAIAPKATIYYVYGPSAFSAIVFAIDLNIAPIISASYSSCEVNVPPGPYRALFQQANAQGITVLAASGDAGAAGCDQQGSEPLATRGESVNFPAVLPEVTGVGGTMFAEGTGTYWATTNSANLGSALAYIPEVVWNESGTVGLLASGGGTSQLYSQPRWQAGFGPGTAWRYVPDISLSAAGHDAYLVYYEGANVGVSGTSCGTPSMAAIVALLNQYQVSKGFQKAPGLGNINPQLYRLSKSAPTAFHDVTLGTNSVSCAQGSPNCTGGAFGYQAGAGYDMATGLGSIDANNLVTQWNTATNSVTVSIQLSAKSATLNDTITANLVVTPVAGGGIPSGTVDLSFDGVALGSAFLTAGSGSSSGSFAFAAYRAGVTGTLPLTAVYSGDAAFSSAGTSTTLRVTNPLSGAAIVVTGPATVYANANTPDAQGPSWQATVDLTDISGPPAMVTGFSIDGQSQTLSQYFPSTEIPAGGTLAVNLVFRNLTAPSTTVLTFTGVDTLGNTWTRQLPITIMPVPEGENFTFSATPLIVAQNPAADPSCQWPVQIYADDTGGFLTLITDLTVGSVDQAARIPEIFGTTRINAYGSAQGTICFGGVTPPATDQIFMELSSGVAQELTVSFTGPAATPSTFTVSPTIVSLSAAAGKTAQTTVALTLSDKTQQWTASIFPANRTTTWLNVTPLSGTGSGQIALLANSAGLEPGAYRAIVALQAQSATPQVVNIPVMFIVGANASSGMTISSVVNSFSFGKGASPGMLMSVIGTQLSNTTQPATGNPLPYSTVGVSATVNGLAAPVLYASSTFLNIQVPYEAGSGPAVLGINNNGQIAGFAFQVTPSAPGVLQDANGNAAPNSAVLHGSPVTIYVTGVGDVSPALKTAYAPSPTGLPLPLLPLSVTVGAVPVFVQSATLASGLVGTAQVTLVVPATVPVGVQPVVVTVNGVPSPPVNLTVSALKTP